MKVGDLVELSMERWRLFKKEEYRDIDKVGVVVQIPTRWILTVQWSTGRETVEFRKNIRHFKGVR